MAKDDQAAEQPEGGGNGSKKKLFIIIGAAVGVAVILAVVFMMMGKGGKKEAGKEGETKTEAKAEGGHGAAAPAKAEGGHGGGAAAGAAAGTSNVFPLDPFIVNIYDGQELRYLKVKVELEMVNATVKSDIETRLAAIRDAILVLISTKTLHDIQDVQGKNQMKDEIMAAINRIIPPGKIAKIYFTDFVVQ